MIDNDHVDTLADVLKSWWTKACRWVTGTPALELSLSDGIDHLVDSDTKKVTDDRRPLHWTDEYFLGCPVIVLSGDKCEDVAIGFAIDHAELGANQYTLVIDNYLGRGSSDNHKIISFGRMFPYSESLLCALAVLRPDEVTAITARGATMLIDPDQPEKLLAPPNRAEPVLDYEKVKAILKYEGFYDHEFFMEKMK